MSSWSARAAPEWPPRCSPRSQGSGDADRAHRSGRRDHGLFRRERVDSQYNHAASVGADDSTEKAALYLRHSVGNQSSESMRQAFLTNGPEAVAQLEAHSEVKFRARQLHPDYNSQLPGSSLKGRVLEAAPFDGRELKDLLKLVREPIPEFMILGGMMVNQEDVLHLLNMLRSFRSFAHSVRILARHALDRLRYPRGTR